jgi:D-proline reductase (dithiol) PrdB
MNESDPSHRVFVSYIDKSREYYLDKGFGNPYRWATYQDAPFTQLPKPLSECRIGLITTAALDKAGSIDRQVYAKAISPMPDAMYTHHLSWHKKATHTRDLGSFLPITHLQQAAAEGRIASLSPRFYGVPTQYSQRLTKQEHAPAILEQCQADDVDVALLVPL